MKMYKGKRTPSGCVVQIVENNGKMVRDLPMKLNLANHSPTGFEWGYAGSGPAQLALALLADALKDDEKALRLHQQFKRRVVQKLIATEWLMTADLVKSIVNQITIEEKAHVNNQR